MDVARKTYSETIEDIHNLVNSYKDEYSIPSLKVNFSARRGHFLTMDAKAMKNNTLPPIFIQVSRQKDKISCSTEDLIRLNQRNNDSLNEISLLSDFVVEKLVHEIRQNLGVIYKLHEAVAFLDFICSLANYSATTNLCTRPELTSDGPLVIKKGRHPVMEKIFKTPFIPVSYFFFFVS